jgi:hypothetical protein
VFLGILEDDVVLDLLESQESERKIQDGGMDRSFR